MRMKNQYSRLQLFSLTLLRVVIGWHFLYEGLSKLFSTQWSCAAYFMDSKGPCAAFFHRLVQSEWLTKIDSLNIWGLIIIGTSLVLGLFARWVTVLGMMMIAMYYMAHPPFPGLEYAMPAEGAYLWVDKNMIELIALLVLWAFPSSHRTGVDRLWSSNHLH